MLRIFPSNVLRVTGSSYKEGKRTEYIMIPEGPSAQIVGFQGPKNRSRYGFWDLKRNDIWVLGPSGDTNRSVASGRPATGNHIMAAC